jgi:hypothetical protein
MENVINVEPDRYGGVIITDMALLADSEDAFRAQLASSLAKWREQGVRSIQIQF